MRVVFVDWHMDDEAGVDNEMWATRNMPAGDWGPPGVEEDVVSFEATLDEEDYHAFLNEWGLKCEVCNQDYEDASIGSVLYYGRMLNALYYSLDGSLWNAGGWTPVRWVNVIISESI